MDTVFRVFPKIWVFIWYLWFFFLWSPVLEKRSFSDRKKIWISADPAGIAPRSEGLLWSPDTNPSVCGFPGRNPGNPAGWKPDHQWMGFRGKKSAGNIRKPWFLPPNCLESPVDVPFHRESIDWDEKAGLMYKKTIWTCIASFIWRSVTVTYKMATETFQVWLWPPKSECCWVQQGCPHFQADPLFSLEKMCHFYYFKRNMLGMSLRIGSEFQWQSNMVHSISVHSISSIHSISNSIVSNS